MADSKKRKEHTVYVHLDLHLEVKVKAANLEEALAEGRGLTVQDVVDLGDAGFNDGSIEVTGVYS